MVYSFFILFLRVFHCALENLQYRTELPLSLAVGDKSEHATDATRQSLKAAPASRRSNEFLHRSFTTKSNVMHQDEPNMSIFMSMFVTMLQFVNVVLHFSFQSVFV